mgnify:CR=1 FL=1
MKVLGQFSAKPAMDGDGVNIRRVADFVTTHFDPFLMMDEIKSDDKQDFIGGFPPHPHRGQLLGCLCRRPAGRAFHGDASV